MRRALAFRSNFTVDMPICEESSVPWKLQEISKGESPSDTRQVTCVACPAKMGTSKWKGTIRGKTRNKINNPPK
jgi:hypothetical protein